MGRNLVPCPACSRQRPRFGDVPPLVLQRRPARPSVRPFNPWQPDSAAAHLIDRWQQLSNSISESWGRLLYLYFNWRQDTYKDLLLIVSLFSTFVVLVGSTRRWLIDSPDERNSATGFWNDIYQVCCTAKAAAGADVSGHNVGGLQWIKMVCQHAD